VGKAKRAHRYTHQSRHDVLELLQFIGLSIFLKISTPAKRPAELRRQSVANL
jgi:hypothetical protein